MFASHSRCISCQYIVCLSILGGEIVPTEHVPSTSREDEASPIQQESDVTHTAAFECRHNAKIVFYSLSVFKVNDRRTVEHETKLSTN